MITKPNRKPLTRKEHESLEYDCQIEANRSGCQCAIVKRYYNAGGGNTGLEYFVTCDLEFVPMEDILDSCYPNVGPIGF